MKKNAKILLACASVLMILSPYPTVAFYPIITLFGILLHSYYQQEKQYHAYQNRAKNYYQQWQEINSRID